MPLQKTPVAINFVKGIDTKTDPYQLSVGSFLTLVNSVFTTTGRLTKRNGFSNITTLPNTDQTTLTTLNDNLIATGSNLYSFSQDTDQWLNKGIVQPVQLATKSLVRVSTSQTGADAAVTSNGLTCLAYTDSGGGSYYQVSDSNTGEQIVSRQILSSSAINPRVFILGPYFIVTFVASVAGTPHLQYIAIPIANPTSPGVASDISASLSSINAGYDAYSINNILYVAWGGAAATVQIVMLPVNLIVSAPVTITTSASDLMSVTADITRQRIFISFWDSSANNGYSIAFDYLLTQVMAKTQIITATPIAEITSLATNGVLTVFYENINSYNTAPSTDPNTSRTDFISTVTVTLPVSGTGVGTVSATTIVLRSVGLASKAFYGAAGTIYMLVAYGDTKQSSAANDSNQPTYFLIDSLGNIYMRLAYSNGGGYVANQVLPNVSFINGSYYVPYLLTDFLATVNKGTNLPTGTPTSAIYTQTGVSLAIFSLNTVGQHSSEIAGALHLTGGQLWEYDGVKPVEHGFHVWPENISATNVTTGGSIGAGTYYYQFTYEWTDNQGNLHRSAPSIPITITTTGSTSTNTIYVPTDRLTYKQPFISPPNPLVTNPIRIVGYRWSVAQQVYYQFTSVTSPTINDTTVDYVTIVDTLSDASILGQTLLYTTGGVVEDIAAPASIASALFNNRLFLIDAEDRNLLWFSKQVIESVPVEMSDLLTLYVAPTSGAQGSTGPMTALGAMDDKLIIFKKDAIYYINGNGPDNTGANSSFSDPVFITGTVGCANPNSIVLIPNGIMFQSDKGIWLLGRGLDTTYIGAPVEGFNSSIVESATAIPATNQVRFVLQNNVTLMYDYFFNQWGTHTNISATSATLYQSAHTYLNIYGQIYQEQSNTYVDGSTPVLMSLTTSWINIAGLQGYERFYFANLLGTYYTPFKLNVSLAYDYNSSASQAIQVLPENYVANWGGEAQWGSGGPWGGPGNVFSARLFPDKQKCQSFQMSIQEVFDPSLGQAAGQGLTLSGLAMIVGVKKGYRTQSAAKSFG
jgi:hypothetical protein